MTEEHPRAYITAIQEVIGGVVMAVPPSAPSLREEVTMPL